MLPLPLPLNNVKLDHLISSTFPCFFRHIVNFCGAGLFSKMMREPHQELANEVAELIDWLFCQPNPIPVNTALAMCGLIKPVFRLPYVPLDRTERERGAQLLEAARPHLPGVKEIRILEDSDFESIGWC